MGKSKKLTANQRIRVEALRAVHEGGSTLIVAAPPPRYVPPSTIKNVAEIIVICPYYEANLFSKACGELHMTDHGFKTFEFCHMCSIGVKNAKRRADHKGKCHPMGSVCLRVLDLKKCCCC